MDRNQAFEELRHRLKNDNRIKHSLAVEAIMRSLAEYLKDEVDKWALAGLMHDIDYDKTAEDPSKHGLVGAMILENIGIDDSVVYAVKAHNDYHGIERKRKVDKALYSSGAVSELIQDCALSLPSKKLKDVSLDYVMEKFNEEGFLSGENKEKISTCSELGLSLEKFIEISLNAMKVISDVLEL